MICQNGTCSKKGLAEMGKVSAQNLGELVPEQINTDESMD